MSRYVRTLGLALLLCAPLARTPSAYAGPEDKAALDRVTVYLRVGGAEHGPASSLDVPAGRSILVEATPVNKLRRLARSPEEYFAKGGVKHRVISHDDDHLKYDVGTAIVEMRVIEEAVVYRALEGILVERLQGRRARLRLAPGYRTGSVEVTGKIRWEIVQVVTAENVPPEYRRHVHRDPPIEGTARFTLRAEPLWFEGTYIRCQGPADERLGRILRRIEADAAYIDGHIANRASIEKNHDDVRLASKRMAAGLQDLERFLAEERGKKAQAGRRAYLLGLPTQAFRAGALTTLNQTREATWKRAERFLEFHDALTPRILELETTYVANVARGMTRSFLDWSLKLQSLAGGFAVGLPTDLVGLISLHDPKGRFAALGVQKELTAVWEASVSDAALLGSQAQTLKMLRRGQAFMHEQGIVLRAQIQALDGLLERLRTVSDQLDAQATRRFKSLHEVRWLP